jgi:hypothetical protein
LQLQECFLYGVLRVCAHNDVASVQSCQRRLARRSRRGLLSTLQEHAALLDTVTNSGPGPSCLRRESFDCRRVNLTSPTLQPMHHARFLLLKLTGMKQASNACEDIREHKELSASRRSTCSV